MKTQKRHLIILLALTTALLGWGNTAKAQNQVRNVNTGTEYTTFASALSDASAGDELMILVSSISLGSDKIDITKNITISVTNNALTNNEAVLTSSRGANLDAITISSGVTLTIRNSTNNRIRIKATNSGVNVLVRVSNGAKLDATGVDFECPKHGIVTAAITSGTPTHLINLTDCTIGGATTACIKLNQGSAVINNTIIYGHKDQLAGGANDLTYPIIEDAGVTMENMNTKLATKLSSASSSVTGVLSGKAGASFTMIGESMIIGCRDGAIQASGTSSTFDILDIQGGKIMNNAKSGNGGGISAVRTKCTIHSGVTIQCNYCSGNGGGVYATTTNGGSSPTYIYAVTIKNNKSTKNDPGTYGEGGVSNIGGGGLYLEDLFFRIEGSAVIEGNWAKGNGGGILAYNMKASDNRRLNITGSDVKIKDNTSNSTHHGGGGIYLLDARCDMNATTVVEDNHAAGGWGGGVYVSANSLLYMVGGTIKGNIADTKGGGVYQNGSMYVSGAAYVAMNSTTGGNYYTNVYLSDNSDIVNINTAGLDCGAYIGISASSNSRQVISGSAAEVDEAYSNHYFFEDSGVSGIFSKTSSPFYNTSSTLLYFVPYTTSGLDSWYGQTASSGTDYTLEDGYITEIKTAAGLAYFSKRIQRTWNDYTGRTVRLTNDISLSGHNWEPIGFCQDCGEAPGGFKGIFDGQGHTVSGISCTYSYDNIGLFGAVTGVVKNLQVGTPTGAAATNLGSVAGYVASGGSVYNCYGTYTLVGEIASDGSLKNCYANTTATNGLARVNAGTVANCYVRGTTGKVGTNTGTVSNCYASTDGTDGDYTAVVSPYEYGTHDNLVGSTPLVKTLNNWVDSQSGTEYAHWARPHTTVINGDYPVLKMDGSEAVAGDGTNLYYGTANGMIAGHKDETEAVYLYKSTAGVVTNVGETFKAPLYIDEDAAITHYNSGAITAYVGVTLKNTQPSSGDSWDWHMFSPALTAAPLGVTYPNNNRINYGVAPSFTFNTDGYLPTIPAANYGEIDYYCYFEPEYHWINLKRNGNSHWHEDAPDGVHEHIDYKATPTADVNVNESTLVPGKGYLLATKQETLLQCKGTLNNSNVSIAVTTQGNFRTGYNFIGNPYQSYYDFEAFADDNAALWGGTASNASYRILSGNIYRTYAYGQSDNPLAAPRCLHPHQGFMIVASNSGTATFDNDNRIVDASSEFRGEHLNYPLVNLIATGEDGNCDLTTVELGRPDRGGALKAYDLHLGKGCIYTHYEDEDYSIAFTQPGLTEVGIRFEADEEATFTMTWDMENGTFDYLHLIDNITGTDVDCLAATEYRFSATPDDYKSRFRLVFGYTGIEENEEEEEEDGSSTGSGTFAFQMGSQLVVNGEGYLEMIDVMGRIVRTEVLQGSQSTVSMPRGAVGVYVLRLTSKGVTRVQKIVVN